MKRIANLLCLSLTIALLRPAPALIGAEPGQRSAAAAAPTRAWPAAGADSLS
ncbi:MAG: hypothetical protein V4754_04240 [Pseudomonadota bacterium]